MPRAEIPEAAEPHARARQRPRQGITAEDLRGTSMQMLISILRNTPARYGEDHMVPLFNSEKGTVIKVTLAEVAAEVARLRTQGVRDDDQGVWPASDAGTTERRTAEPREALTPPSTPGDSMPAASGCTTVTFTSRAELIRHLASTNQVGGRHLAPR